LGGACFDDRGDPVLVEGLALELTDKNGLADAAESLKNYRL